ncbi:hypothetical protein M407DRAFT_246893 [Tulasnella calospora MUT 4182]|uniref:Uncharacterized protein n=1 Tax=Tulasnella calospora MUT 4182 TaxID=1051891 RepID=A0A0C3Q300_9AGAM|nr:hypothetical protein M407DRAFT_246893 [Tulasnella calospora MUT 4182]
MAPSNRWCFAANQSAIIPSKTQPLASPGYQGPRFQSPGHRCYDRLHLNALFTAPLGARIFRLASTSAVSRLESQHLDSNTGPSCCSFASFQRFPPRSLFTRMPRVVAHGRHPITNSQATKP